MAPEAATEAPVLVEPPPAPVETPARPVPAKRAQTGPLTQPRRAPEPAPAFLGDDRAWAPATPPTRGPALVSPYAGQKPETVLATARAYLTQQDEAAAAAALDHLVGAGALMKSVITELEGVVDSPRASAQLLRVLGDAYVRSDRLQQALDIYRQALRRL